MYRYGKNSEKLFIFLVATTIMLVLFSACSNPTNQNLNNNPGTNTNSSDLKFNVNNAKAIAGYSATAAKALGSRYAGTRSSNLAELMKIKEDGTMESAISFPTNAGGWTPDVSFISTGADRSVYICFSNPYTTWSNSTSANTQPTNTTIQFVRVYPDNHYDILWPLNPSNFNWSTDGQVNTWTWPGMDSDPLQKGADGQLYFKVTSYSTSGSSDAIYSYDPEVGGKPVERTPANAKLSIESFKVDSQKHLFIKSQNNGSGSSSYMRYYTQGVPGLGTIYYSSSGNVWVRGYNTTASGNAVILNGNDINGMSGIIRANLQQSGFPTYDLLYSTTQNYSTWINLQENTGGMVTPNALFYKDTTANTYKWVSEVLTTGGTLDKTKLLARVNSLFYSTPTIADENFDVLKAIDLNATVTYTVKEKSGSTLTKTGTFANAMMMEAAGVLRYYFIGTLLVDWLEEKNLVNFNVSNVSTIFEASDNSLYCLYGGNFWAGMNSDGTKILKLLDASGNKALDVLPISHGDAKPSKIKMTDDYVYYRYSVMIMNGTTESGSHKLARLNLVTGTEEELLTATALANRDLELQTYDISSDGLTMYISALDYDTNAIIFGKIDLTTKAFTSIEADFQFNTVRTF